VQTSPNLLSKCVFFSVVVMALVQSSHGDIVFSTVEDFQQGVFVNLYIDAHALQINDWQRTKTADPPVLPYIWVACSQRGTVVRIATEEHCSPVDGRWVQAGEILGEYRTAPTDHLGIGGGPSASSHERRRR